MFDDYRDNGMKNTGLWKRLIRNIGLLLGNQFILKMRQAGVTPGVLESNQEKEEFVIWNRFAKPQGFGAGVQVFLQDSVFLVFLFSWPGFSK